MDINVPGNLNHLVETWPDTGVSVLMKRIELYFGQKVTIWKLCNVVHITEINKVKKLTVSFAFICIILTIKFSEMIHITSRGFFCYFHRFTKPLP